MTQITAGLIMTLDLMYPFIMQSFSKIIEDKLLYVDKTAIIDELLRGGSVYFLSRPRRFGKSLLISTLDALLSGRKALFEGLAIADTDYDFVTYPVIRVDFSGGRFVTADELKNHIINTLDHCAHKYKVELFKDAFALRFMELMIKLYEKTGRRVVLLVDEYDKPILNNLKKPAVLAQEEQMDKLQMLAKIKYWYNGYQFHPRAVGVYNPFSLLSLFEFEEFNNYWYSTATPTFLLDLLQDKQYDLSELSTLTITASAFSSTEPEDMDVLSLFVQTGYLTIKGYRNARYTLDFPNYEVKRSFFDSVATRYDCLDKGVDDAYIYDLIDYLNAGKLDDFFKTLKIFFANIPYELNVDREKYYQSLFYAIITMIGLSVEAEVSTEQGRMGTQASAHSLCSHEVSPRMGEGSATRTFICSNSSINCVLQTADTIYIVEFKLNGTKEQALKQIQDNQYAQKYLRSNKAIVLLSVEFDQKSRNISDTLRHDLVVE